MLYRGAVRKDHPCEQSTAPSSAEGKPQVEGKIVQANGYRCAGLLFTCQAPSSVARHFLFYTVVPDLENGYVSMKFPNAVRTSSVEPTKRGSALCIVIHAPL